MAARRLSSSPALTPLVAGHSFLLGQLAWHYRPRYTPLRAASYATTQPKATEEKPSQSSDADTRSLGKSIKSSESDSDGKSAYTADWEDDPDFSISTFAALPHRHFGTNQHIRINEDFKESLRQILWKFRAPIRYAFAYGSGVFSQSSKIPGPGELSPHPNPPEAVTKWQQNGGKVIDFIFGVSYTQHWHDINLQQHRDHYSGLGRLGSYALSKVQDSWGAGVYFNPYITVNGVMIKYGVVNLDTINRDLSEWDTLYIAGRLQKPVKILRDDPRVRLTNQINLMSAVRTALLMLPERFTERELYETITGLSYMGDPRMRFGSESTSKVRNIVRNQLPNFRQLYVPLIGNLPNVDFNDAHVPKEDGWEREEVMARSVASRNPSEIIGGADGFTMQQDMSPQRRGNMVRRLPRNFRHKLYFQYRKKFGIPGSAFDQIIDDTRDEDATRRREAGDFERRIGMDADVAALMGKCVSKTISWPSTSQSIKGLFTAGASRGWRYWSEKRKRYGESAKSEEQVKQMDKDKEAGSKQKDEKSES